MPRLTRARKAAFVTAMREGDSFDAACRRLALKPTTVRRRCAADGPAYDPLFAEAVAATQSRGENDLVATVEQAFIARLLEGKATCSDYTFWLCNRAPERWCVPQKAYLDPAVQTQPPADPAEMTVSEMLEAFVARNGKPAHGTR